MELDNPFGALGAIHGDVLNADPITLPDKLNLVGEIKSRCKAVLGNKHYGEADTLYSKAIEVLSPNKDTENAELAILYSNRSLCRCATHKYDLAVEDARQAIECNASYVKGHWRLGTAFSAWEKYEDALRAFERGMEFLPPGESDKAWKKEIEKCKENMGGSPKKAPVKSIVSSTATTTASRPPTTKTNNADEEDQNIFTPSDAVRGYKIVGGKKTSYFHREQTEEEKKLIGDIAPKRISDRTAVNAPAEEGDNLRSAWNKAGTWEEKDVSNVAKEQLTASLLQASASVPCDAGSSVRVTKVSAIEGHASVATVRSKRRFVYEYSFSVDWEMDIASSGDTLTGSMKYPEVDGTCNGTYDITEFKVNESGCHDSPSLKLAKDFVVNGGLSDDIRNRINQWIATLKAMYGL